MLIPTEDLARRVRRHCIEMTNRGSSSHIASALSCTDILATLYGEILRVDPANPKAPHRDRFILSKGHAGAAVYATLAERGFFPTEKLKGHYQDGADLSGHVSHKGIPGVELSTGSLGHGLSVGVGLAYSAKLDGSDHRAFVLLSDGEFGEGSNWEAIMFAGHHKLDNLTAIVDYNKYQSLMTVEDTLRIEPFADKFRAFGWNVTEVDGHDHKALIQTFSKLPLTQGSPSAVIAHTTKGKGVSFMENVVKWHYFPPKGEEFDKAMSELGDKQ